MKLTLLLLVFALYAVNAEQERFNRKRWPFRQFDRFDDNPYGTSDRLSKFRNENKFTRLLVDRQMFYYWDNNYDNWTNWTTCSAKNCTKSRYRKCKDSSWKENVSNFKKQRKCPVQFIFEKKICNDTELCFKKTKDKHLNLSISRLPENCGLKPSQIENKIYGGDDVSTNSWPWHVGLYASTKHRSIYICGGTLINPGWVVTAAHCLKTIERVSLVPLGELIDTRKYEFYDNFQVVIGDHDRANVDKSEIRRKISHFIIHQSFRADYTSNLYDVALLKLDEIVPKNDNIDFACVPPMKNYTLPTTQTCLAIGWGDTKSQDPFNIWSFEFDWILDRWRKNRRNRNSNILQEVEIPLVDFKQCQRRYRLFNLNKDIHICAGSLTKDTCRGDSGGGLFCQDPDSQRWQLYGITNFGSARGCGKSYGVYIRVAELADWIREVIQKQTV